MDTTLIKQTKIYKFSTQSSSGICLNEDPSYKSSFYYTLPPINFHEEDIESVYVSVPYVSIPVSFYNIDSHNNVLYITITSVPTSPNDLTLGFEWPIEFRSGHYNVTNFITEFKRASEFLNSGSFSVTYDKFTNKFTIVNSDPQYYFSISHKSTISSVMGFSTSLSSTYSNGLHSIIMPRCANFLYSPRIHLRCYELLTGTTHLVAKNGINCDSDILISIPNDSQGNGKITYTSSHTGTLLDIPFINNLTINFTDENNNLLNFNGVSSYFEIQIDIFRRKSIERKPTFKQLIKQLSSILE